MREEVLPKNILMIGPTGVGKTEISRRLAKLAGAPFLKVEATKFTEVGYVGRDVDQIVRDLVEVGIGLVRDGKRKEVEAKAQLAAEERVLDALVGPRFRRLDARDLPQEACARASSTTRRSRSRCRHADHARFRHSRHAGQPGRHDQSLRDARQGVRPAHQAAPVSVRDSFDDADGRGERQADRQRSDRPGGHQERREQRHRVPRRDRQDLRAIRACRRRRLARGRAARSPAADRRHHGRHEIRTGEDRPYPVHRLGRVPHRQAVGPAARIAGPAADPRRATRAHPRRFPPHPHRAQGLPHQAICRADADRRASSSTSRPTRSTPSPTSRSR